MHSEQDSVRFVLRSGTVTIDMNVLEKMKAALLSFLDDPAFPARFSDLRERILAELKASATWIQGQEARIGAWRLENREECLTLVHYPPPSNAPHYIYHATLGQKNSEWKIMSFEQEHEFGPM